MKSRRSGASAGSSSQACVPHARPPHVLMSVDPGRHRAKVAKRWEGINERACERTMNSVIRERMRASEAR